MFIDFVKVKVVKKDSEATVVASDHNVAATKSLVNTKVSEASLLKKESHPNEDIKEGKRSFTIN